MAVSQRVQLLRDALDRGGVDWHPSGLFGDVTVACVLGGFDAEIGYLEDEDLFNVYIFIEDVRASDAALIVELLSAHDIWSAVYG